MTIEYHPKDMERLTFDPPSRGSWLEQIEQQIDKGIIPKEPINFKMPYEGREYYFSNGNCEPNTPQRYVNALVIEQWCILANDLLKYGVEAKKQRREGFLDKARKLWQSYNMVLQSWGAIKDSAHIYKEGVSRDKYLKGFLSQTQMF